jgi:hypothetical protein
MRKSKVTTPITPIRQKVDIPYYDDTTRVSRSSLKWFMESPMVFKHNIDNPPQLSDKYLAAGIMIHMWLLEKDKFWNHYYISNFRGPKSPQQGNFIYNLQQSLSYGELDDNTIIMAYKNSYNTKNMSNEELVVKSLSAYKEVKQVLDERVHNVGKESLTDAEYEDLQQYELACKEHKAAKMLLWPTDEGIHTFSEFHINWQHSTTKLDCKSLIDKIHFDIENKLVRLIDLKTTSDATDFAKSYKNYDYAMQIEFYREAVEWYITNILKDNPDQWRWQFSIIAVQKIYATTVHRPYVVVYEIPKSSLYKEEVRINEYMDKLLWHIKNDRWEHTIEYYGNDGFETLELDED